MSLTRAKQHSWQVLAADAGMCMIGQLIAVQEKNVVSSPSEKLARSLLVSEQRERPDDGSYAPGNQHT